jgi:hypothetical protein
MMHIADRCLKKKIDHFSDVLHFITTGEQSYTLSENRKSDHYNIFCNRTIITTISTATLAAGSHL